MSLFRKITETVSKGMSTAAEKAQHTVEITRLSAQISSKRKEIEKRYIEIGEAVYGGYAAGDIRPTETKVVSACGEIAAIVKEIEALDERIMQLRNEKTCECGKRVPYETRYCPSCGRKFPEPDLAADPAAGPAEAALSEEGREEAEHASGCPGCGAAMEASAKYCPACGMPRG